MVSSIFLPRVGGYDISKISKDRYSVAVNNGNIGACQMNKEQFNVFIQEQKEKGNVKPPVAKIGLLATLGLVGLNILTKGKLLNSAKSIVGTVLDKAKNVFKK